MDSDNSTSDDSSLKRCEVILPVPRNLMKQCTGLSIDIGASVFKAAYRSKEDEAALESDSETGRFRLVSFSKDQLFDGLQYLLERADISRKEETRPTIQTTGVGCTQFGKLICETLNINMHQLTEFDCFVKSFVYLSAHLTRSQLLEPFVDDAVAEPVANVIANVVARRKAQDANITKGFNLDQKLEETLAERIGRPPAPAGDEPLAVAESGMFPCILVMCGSAVGYMKVEADGSFKMVDLTLRAGRSFLGAGTLLVGCKDYDELMELASKGNTRNVDEHNDDVHTVGTPTDNDESSYVLMAKNTKSAPGLLFHFGKAVASGKADFRREDVARAWLNYVLIDFVQCSENVCARHDVKRVFFAGGFCSHPLVRRIMTTEFVRRNLVQHILNQTDAVQFDFVKPGQHLGALGCIITEIENNYA